MKMEAADVWERVERLSSYIAREGYRGWDPFDGLNSRLLARLPAVRGSRVAQIMLTQLFKLSPINLRPLFGVRREYNPKALSLLITGYGNLYRLTGNAAHLRRVEWLCGKLIGLRSEGWSGACWGYNFDWRSRSLFLPRYTPTVVVTTYAASALLDAYEITRRQTWLETVVFSRHFILKDLQRSPDGGGAFCFSYSPRDRNRVYNASLLASRLLARIYRYEREPELLEAARQSVRYCCDRQNGDGSWAYGEEPHQRWIDNFHTGYNLECLQEYRDCSGDDEFRKNIEAGLAFYLERLFTCRGIARYYAGGKYPIDIHAQAQLIITLYKLGLFPARWKLLEDSLDWTLRTLQAPDGYFYYQKRKYFINRIPYMRWAQAWMLAALSFYLLGRKQLIAAPRH